MNIPILSSLILTAIGGALGLSGSEFFWVILWIFPVFIFYRVFSIKLNSTSLFYIFFYGIILVAFLSGFSSTGGLLTGTYIFLALIILWKLLLGEIRMSEMDASGAWKVLVCLILSMILSSMIGTYAENRYNARIATQLAEEKAIKDALDAKIKLKNSMIHTGVLEPTPASIPTHTGQVFIQ